VLFGVGFWNAACFAFSASEQTVLGRRNAFYGFVRVSMRKRSSEHVDYGEKRREKWDLLQI